MLFSPPLAIRFRDGVMSFRCEIWFREERDSAVYEAGTEEEEGKRGIGNCERCFMGIPFGRDWGIGSMGRGMRGEIRVERRSDRGGYGEGC